MPQTKRDAAHRYFEYEQASNKSTCLLCKNKLKGKHTSNLKNHLATKHLEEYKIVIDLNKTTVETPNDNNVSSPAPKVEKIKNICMRLVTIHGRPLAMMEDEAFQDLVNMAASEKHASRSTNTKAVKKYIKKTATEIREKISNETKNELLSLKLDAVTCQERKFIGINIQYIKDTNIVIRNLGVLEIYERQTAEFLRTMVEATLAEFRISLEQIYCICTDNGSNMVKMVKIMGGEYCSSGENDEDSDSQDEEEELNNYSMEDFFIGLDMENIITNESFKIRGMLCAAHTLQLAVKDAINDNVIAQNTITTARRIVNILRTPNIANKLRRTNSKKAIKDCPTRWCSAFYMLERLFSLREFCKSIAEILSISTDVFWNEVHNLIVCLKPAAKATQILQKKHFTTGDFFITWFNCKNEMNVIESNFASDLHQAMEKREVKLLENDVILEGLYLDGRLNIVLSAQQCQKARELLNGVSQQMHRVKESALVPDAEAREEDLISEIDHLRHEEPSTSRASTALEEMLKNTERVRGRGSGQRRSFDICLHEVLTIPRLPLTENILLYWQNKSVSSSELSMVAKVVLSAPMTQVSVERLFSSLKYILNPLRSNLGSIILKDLMIIRENKDLL